MLDASVVMFFWGKTGGNMVDIVKGGGGGGGSGAGGVSREERPSVVDAVRGWLRHSFARFPSGGFSSGLVLRRGRGPEGCAAGRALVWTWNGSGLIRCSSCFVHC